jgi:hypothetical protein
MNRLKLTKSLKLFGASGIITAALTIAAVPVMAAATTQLTTAQQQDLQNIINKGNQEITRRLDTLETLSSKISAATKITASDKSYLTAEVSTEATGLTSLKTQLDADTTLATARTDAQSIITEYRVYALVVPKVWLVKTADDQQLTESQLTTLAQKIQTKITADQTAGKAVTSLQTELNDMTTQIANALKISSTIETNVLPLQPSDYDNDHTILSGDAAQLNTAHGDNVAAYTDAKNIIASLKTL